MSYSRNYHETVSGSYHRTVSVSYPASQSGGSTSVTVSGTVEVPVDIEIYVDTDRFDDNVDGCRNSVNMLNAAVVATTAEEIRVKKEASQKIGNSVVKGFFDYISAELSQLKSELSTKCDSILATLLEQKQACWDKRLQMKGDYDRITTRYLKLFNDLDSEMATRIRAVDKQTFAVNRDLLASTSRTTDTSLLGVATIIAAETAQIDAILAASSIKNRARVSIDKTREFLEGTYILQKTVQDMLFEGAHQATYKVPVMYVSSVGSDTESHSKIYGSDAVPLRTIKNLDEELTKRFRKSTLSWGEMATAESEQIDRYFNSELSAANLDARVSRTILELKESNNFKIVTKA